MGSFETLPIKEIDKIYEEALNFYKNFYSAERMNLMLICNKSLDELADLAYKYFNDF